MKKTILLYFLSALGLVFLSCQHSVDGVYFDEAAFNEAKLKWEKIKIEINETYRFEYGITFGKHNVSNPPTVRAYIGNEVLVTNGVPTINNDKHKRGVYDYYNTGLDLNNSDAVEELYERLENEYGITSAMFLTYDDMFRLIEERVTEAKKRYNHSKWLFYKMEVTYDDRYYFPEYARDYYVYNKFGDKDEIDNIMFRIIPMGLNWD
ncbi:MAG: hypothetical protein IJU92_00830 [Spirochaetaceae bacterium]|nr:hypothetical protein [Spirochaetaceae bacterium]